jgi:hypothetical protein
MPVMIEELHADVGPLPEAGAPAQTPPAAEAPDERTLLEVLAHELWAAARLKAD